MIVVQKFGGTSVGTPERIVKAARRVAEAYRAGQQLIIVVSAMGDTTDRLIELANAVSPKPPAREMDMLLTAGERISMSLMSMALSDLEIPAVSLTGSQVGIITDGHHRRARIKKILGKRVKEALAENKVVIVAGFQGVSETKEVTTLGRGGSDTTAVALAAHFKANRCDIFTDVTGVYSADPRAIPSAKFYPRLPSDLMVEMALSGAGVLHPRCVELAHRFRVPLWVRNTFEETNELKGTQIMNAESTTFSPDEMESFQMAAVTADDSKGLAVIELSRPSVISAILDFSTESNLQMLAPHFEGGRLFFFYDVESESEWRKALGNAVIQGFVTRWELHPENVPLSIVGYRFAQSAGAMSQVLDCLAKIDIFVTIGTSSSMVMTLSVAKHRAEEAVQVLHQKLIAKEV